MERIREIMNDLVGITFGIKCKGEHKNGGGRAISCLMARSPHNGHRAKFELCDSCKLCNAIIEAHSAVKKELEFPSIDELEACL